MTVVITIVFILLYILITADTNKKKKIKLLRTHDLFNG